VSTIQYLSVYQILNKITQFPRRNKENIYMSDIMVDFGEVLFILFLVFFGRAVGIR
jgi:hypothetical protein